MSMITDKFKKEVLILVIFAFMFQVCGYVVTIIDPTVSLIFGSTGLLGQFVLWMTPAVILYYIVHKFLFKGEPSINI